MQACSNGQIDAGPVALGLYWQGRKNHRSMEGCVLSSYLKGRPQLPAGRSAQRLARQRRWRRGGASNGEVVDGAGSRAGGFRRHPHVEARRDDVAAGLVLHGQVDSCTSGARQQVCCWAPQAKESLSSGQQQDASSAVPAVPAVPVRSALTPGVMQSVQASISSRGTGSCNSAQQAQQAQQT